jgi:TldD protein
MKVKYNKNIYTFQRGYIMFTFPSGLYTDVRIEDVFETKIIYTMGNLEESRVRKFKAAFVRVFDGKRWYYASTSDIENVQREIDTLSSLAKPDDKIYDHPVIKRFESICKKHLMFQDTDVSKISIEDKQALLKSFFSTLSAHPMIRMWRAMYVDKKVVKEFISSKGTNLMFDTQTTGAVTRFVLGQGDKNLNESLQKSYSTFADLKNLNNELESYIMKCEVCLALVAEAFMGKYPCCHGG